MSDADEVDEVDDGAWGEVCLEPPFEDDCEAPAMGLDDDVASAAHEAGAVALAAADDATAPATLALPIDIGALLEALAFVTGKIAYGLGSKPSRLSLSPAELVADRAPPAGIDCSGFVRWILYRASGGKVKIPDGSWNQRDHFRELARRASLPASPYATCGLHDGVLRVAGFTKSERVSVGHIWLVHDGQTAESHGGKGVNRRPWDQRSLVRLATWCYPLARLAT